MADDFFTRQLPHNVTWVLSLLYALDQKGLTRFRIERTLPVFYHVPAHAPVASGRCNLSMFALSLRKIMASPQPTTRFSQIPKQSDLPHTMASDKQGLIRPAGDFGDTAFQGRLVFDMRYLASVVMQCFSAFGELLSMPKRFAELSGGVTRVAEMLEVVHKVRGQDGHTRGPAGCHALRTIPWAGSSIIKALWILQ